MNSAKVYLESRERLRQAKGFCFLHYFDGNDGRGKYRLEGTASAWDRSHFNAFDDSGSTSEWMCFLQKDNRPHDYGGLRPAGFSKPVFKNYKLTEWGWQLKPEEGNLAVYGCQEIITLDILGNSHKASRDITYSSSQFIGEKKCHCYQRWSLDGGGHYTLWIDLRNSDIVQVEQVQPWGNIKTLISNLGEPITIQEP